MPEYDDLRSTLLELTEPPPAPADPALLVRQRVGSVRRRRCGTVAVLVAAAATAAVLAAGPVSGVLRAGPDDEPGVSSEPTITPTTVRSTAKPVPAPTPTYNDPAKNAKLPAPWKDRPYTRFPERNLYAPLGTYLAEGEIAGHPWFGLTYTANKLSEGCIHAESTDGTASDLGLDSCFDEWPAGRRVNYTVNPALAGRKPDYEPLKATFVGGAVSAEARSVVIRTSRGNEYRTDAIGTPTSDKLRFFLYVVPERDARMVSVKPLTADGSPAGPPVGLPPEGGQCYDGPREGFPNGGGSACKNLSTPTK